MDEILNRLKQWQDSFDLGSSMFKGSILSYLKEIAKHPARHLRTSAGYIADAIEYFGKRPIIQYGELLWRYNIFDDPFGNGRNAVYGHDKQINTIVRDLRSIELEQSPPRIIELAGPVGTGKTPLVEMIMKAMEEYSKVDEGQQCTVTWLFDNTIPRKIRLRGFGFNKPKYNGKYNVEDIEKKLEERLQSDNVFRFECQVNDHPVLTIPRNIYSKEKGKMVPFRSTILKDLVKEQQIPSYFLEKDACINCQTIFKRLMESYDNDINAVLSHLLISNMTFSANAGVGLSSIEPQNMLGFDDVKVIADKQLSEFMPGMTLYAIVGNIPSSCKGLMHIHDGYSGRGGRDTSGVADLNKLLRIVASREASTTHITTPIDTTVFLTTNLEERRGVTINPANEKWFSRTTTFLIPRLRDFYYEMDIYKKELSKVAEQTISPYTLQAAAMWGVLTRLEYVDYSNKDITDQIPGYDELNDEQKTFLENITVYQKFWIYAAALDLEIIPRRNTDPGIIKVIKNLGLQETRELEEASRRHRLREVHEKDGEGKDVPVIDEEEWPLIDHKLVYVIARSSSYEGEYGVDCRAIQDIFREITRQNPNNCVSPVDFFSFVEDKILTDTKGEKYPFMKLEIDEEAPIVIALTGKKRATRKRDEGYNGYGGYYDFKQHLEFVKSYWASQVIDSAVECICGVSREDIVSRLARYIQMVNVRLRKKSILHKVTGERLKPDLDFMNSIEYRLGVAKQERERFRKQILLQYHAAVDDLRDDEKLRHDLLREYSEIGEVYDPSAFFPEHYQCLLKRENVIHYRLDRILEAIERYNTNEWDLVESPLRKEAKAIVGRFNKKGFPTPSVKVELKYLHEKGYLHEKLFRYIPEKKKASKI